MLVQKNFFILRLESFFSLISCSVPSQLQSHNFEILSFLSRKCEVQIFSYCNCYVHYKAGIQYYVHYTAGTQYYAHYTAGIQYYVHYTAGIQYSLLRFNCSARNLSLKFSQSRPCARLPCYEYIAIRKLRISARNVWSLKITTLAVLLINPLKTNSS